MRHMPGGPVRTRHSGLVDEVFPALLAVLATSRNRGFLADRLRLHDNRGYDPPAACDPIPVRISRSTYASPSQSATVLCSGLWFERFAH